MQQTLPTDTDRVNRVRAALEKIRDEHGRHWCPCPHGGGARAPLEIREFRDISQEREPGTYYQILCAYHCDRAKVLAALELVPDDLLPPVRPPRPARQLTREETELRESRARARARDAGLPYWPDFLDALGRARSNGPAAAAPAGWRPSVGDMVRPPDRDNVVEVVEERDGDMFVCVATSPEGVSSPPLEFHLSGLRPLEDHEPATRNGTGRRKARDPLSPEELDEIFETRYVNPADPVVPKPPDHVEDLLRPGYTILAGPPKLAKKTWFMTALSLHVHAGKPFLGRAVNRARCGWLQLDSAEWDFQGYADQLAHGMHIPPEPMPYLASPEIDLYYEDYREGLVNWIKAEKIEVLFVDSSRAVSSVNENASDEVRELVRLLFCGILRHQLKVSVVLITHTPHGALRARGSGEWAGGADSTWTLDPGDEKNPSGVVTIRTLGRHQATTLCFEVVHTVEPGKAPTAAVREVAWQEAKNRSVDNQDRLEAAYAIVRAAGSAGITQSDLHDALKERKQGMKGTLFPAFVDLLLKRHGDLASRREKGRGGRPATVIFPNFPNERENKVSPNDASSIDETF